MPTIVGTNTLNSISSRVIVPYITDTVYREIALFWRLNQANKKIRQSGTHLEVPFLYQTWGNVSAYSPYDVLDVAPQDTIKNGGLDRKYYRSSVVVSGPEVDAASSEDAITNYVVNQVEQAKRGLANLLGNDMWRGSTFANPKQMGGMVDLVDDGSVVTTYAGLPRASNPFLNAYVNATSNTLTLTVLRSLVSALTRGAESPTSLWGRTEQYDRAWALLLTFYNLNMSAVQTDVALGNVGFRNFIFDGIPFIVDSRVPDGPNSSNSAIIALNENHISLWVSPKGDFTMRPWVIEGRQDVASSMIRWYGNIVCRAPFLNGKLTNISA